MGFKDSLSSSLSAIAGNVAKATLFFPKIQITNVEELSSDHSLMSAIPIDEVEKKAVSAAKKAQALNNQLTSGLDKVASALNSVPASSATSLLADALDNVGLLDGRSLEVQFNPASLDISAYGGGRTVITNYGNEDGNVKGATSFGALSVSIQVSFTLIFDETFLSDAFASDKFQLTASNLIGGVASLISTAVTGKTYTVRPFVEGFLAAMRDPDHRTVIFQWGRLRYVGMMNQLSARYTMFNPNGEPIRAEVDVTMYSESLPSEQYKASRDKARNLVVKMESSQNDNDYLGYWTNRYNAIVEGKDSLSGKTIKNVATSLLNL